ncbi:MULTISPECIES: antitoxin [Planktothricoides]|uniref:Type II toxin-antitoxin system VapB family antitoxin n=2 Tax=Planktothricoides raciborskii TaxID=132608 RepID=A0AAU8JDY1_9CYAN|nr:MULTISPECIES: type II toxin-antitoxin system VapB family antitoxin [Planktothricoides]KOR38022.1 virulence factor [Planktothricoides sp. SR001]MBD2542890.1 AbrB/MazE/SpoVT family DNA-binding domain-containing protein [Planktothricoides raciborskii FACHB-1370]MBD2581363.1 AbrB/MazE/SpoVT family DNA-binding domain-containing protein [Planktothricoides raciborskii FACHB-1261]
MNLAKIVQNGNTQSLILPDEFHLEGDEVYIKKVGTALVVIPKNNPWQPLFDSLSLFSEDFMETREQPKLETREDIFE